MTAQNDNQSPEDAFAELEKAKQERIYVESIMHALDEEQHWDDYQDGIHYPEHY